MCSRDWESRKITCNDIKYIVNILNLSTEQPEMKNQDSDAPMCLIICWIIGKDAIFLSAELKFNSFELYAKRQHRRWVFDHLTHLCNNLGHIFIFSRSFERNTNFHSNRIDFGLDHFKRNQKSLRGIHWKWISKMC